MGSTRLPYPGHAQPSFSSFAFRRQPKYDRSAAVADPILPSISCLSELRAQISILRIFHCRIAVAFPFPLRRGNVTSLTQLRPTSAPSYFGGQHVDSINYVQRDHRRWHGTLVEQGEIMTILSIPGSDTICATAAAAKGTQSSFAAFGNEFSTIAFQADNDANEFMEALPDLVGLIGIDGRGLRHVARMDDKGTPLAPVQRMLCCCCGGVFPGRQFHNQDTGYGLGDCCVEFVSPRTEDMERTYGRYGIHYGISKPGA